MQDLISRQAAIDALRYAQHRFTVADEAGGMGTVKWSEYVIYFAEAERILTELSSAQPEKSTEKRTETHACDLISRQAAIDAVEKYDFNFPEYMERFVTELRDAMKEDLKGDIADLPSVQPEQHHDEWCTDCKEYDKERHCCPRFNRVIRTAMGDAQPEWNNHTVACLLAELFDDNCACNYCGIDEWLPSKCELLDACPNPVGVACWEQYLKHRVERRTDERTDER